MRIFAWMWRRRPGGVATCYICMSTENPRYVSFPSFHAVNIQPRVLCLQWIPLFWSTRRSHTLAWGCEIIQGCIYVKFGAVEEATRAYNMLNHRWFDGRMVSVDYIPVATYNTKFSLK